MAKKGLDQGSDLGKENLWDEAYLPRLFVGGHISHYYGDTVRRIFLGTAVILFASAPFFPDSAVVLIPLLLVGAVTLITLSALTNPKNKLIMVANAIASLVGVVLFELLAIAAYRAEVGLAMVAFQALTIAFIFALYLSLKTVRAMELHQIGKRDLPGEFLEEKYEEARGER